jgi:hypothetical protein
MDVGDSPPELPSSPADLASVEETQVNGICHQIEEKDEGINQEELVND